MSYRALGTYYYLRLLEPEDRTEAGVLLPDESRDRVTDGLVLSAGPGRIRPDGSRHRMQAKVGDRVVVPYHHWQELEAGEGLVADEHLAALLPGPEHEAILPAEGYCLIRPERLRTPNPSGVLVAGHSLIGGGARDLLRGRQAHRELRELQQTERFQGLDWNDQIRAVHDYMRQLTPGERRELGVALEEERRGMTGAQLRRPITMPTPNCRGVLLTLGSGRREPGFAPGDTVWWDRYATYVSLFDGYQEMLALPMHHLCAVEA